MLNNDKNEKHKMRNHLEEFWKIAKPKEALLILLSHYSKAVIRVVPPEELSQKRKKFSEARHMIMPNINSYLCFCCDKVAVHRHHIISLKNGGNLGGKNLVPLCIDCHKVIHPHMKMEEIYDTPEIPLPRPPKYQRRKNSDKIGGQPWSVEEEKQLICEFNKGMELGNIAKIHKRKEGGIRSRLQKLGILEI
jgi:hypothetical protein